MNVIILCSNRCLYNKITLTRQIALINEQLFNPSITLIYAENCAKIKKEFTDYDIRFIEQPPNCNDSFGLRLGLERFPIGDVLVLTSDLVFNKNFLKIPHETFAFIDINNQIKINTVGVIHNNTHILSFDYKQKSKWIGAFMLSESDAVNYVKFSRGFSPNLMAFEVLQKMILSDKMSCGIINTERNVYKITTARSFNNNYENIISTR